METLETRALRALKDGKCVPYAEEMPPLYCTGAILAATTSDNKNDDHTCFSWLDKQPSHCIVFLCFGSMGFFSTKLLKEMAMRLKRSGAAFLWVVLFPPLEDEFRRTLTVADAEASAELFSPEGFVERTRDWGLPVKSWAPQVDVLSHDSVVGLRLTDGGTRCLKLCVPGFLW